MIWTLLAVFATGISLWWWKNYARIPRKFPRGPYGLPIIGYPGIVKSPNLIEAFKVYDLQVKYTSAAANTHCFNPEGRVRKKIQPKFEAGVRTPMKRASKHGPI